VLGRGVGLCVGMCLGLCPDVGGVWDFGDIGVKWSVVRMLVVI